MSDNVTSDDLIAAYASGFFPMAEDRYTEELYWFNPTKRGVLPLDDFNIPRGLKKAIRSWPVDIKIDQDFESVIRACADVPRHEDGAWISERIIELYCELHEKGYAHSVESWQDGQLVGGLYGISLGNAFFGESMFSKVSEASKLALVHLVARLRKAGYSLLDTQFVNAHLQQFGVQEVTKKRYLSMLDKALNASTNASHFFTSVEVESGSALLSSFKSG